MTAENSSYKDLKVGNMSEIVYAVEGGLEDFCAAGSYEFNAIGKCKPTTYLTDNKIVEYDFTQEKYKYAFRSLVFLLEASYAKEPKPDTLGKKKDECLIGFKNSAYYNNQKYDPNQCDKNNGYFSNFIRMSLTLIDLLLPYIIPFKKDDGVIEWVVGGAKDVNETFVKYNYFTKEEYEALKCVKMECPEEVIDKLKLESGKLNGYAIWSKEYKKENNFKFNFDVTKGGYVVYTVYAKVDKKWGESVNASPHLPPQSVLVQLRTNKDYVAENPNFQLKGMEYVTLKKPKVILLSAN
jgi:hypothetical protein